MRSLRSEFRRSIASHISICWQTRRASNKSCGELAEWCILLASIIKKAI
ncbi:MAG: hypothetical protein ACXQTS_04930 [Candidatus Methanospirareceae archaeon]